MARPALALVHEPTRARVVEKIDMQIPVDTAKKLLADLSDKHGSCLLLREAIRRELKRRGRGDCE